MSERFLNDRVELHCGDCRQVLATLPENSFDACCTDPPYGLEFMGKDWDAPWQVFSSSALFGKRQTKMPGWGVTRNPTCRTCGGRLRGANKCSCETPAWDEAPSDTRLRQMSAFQDWCQDWAQQVYRVLKPGAHLVAMGGTRTYHRLACAIEDAGFEIRDTVSWLYGSGFPKSHDVSKGIDRAAGAAREIVAYDPARARPNRQYEAGAIGNIGGLGTISDRSDNGATITAPATDAACEWQGWGTALKPACELIVLARKPLGTGDIDVRRNVERDIIARGFVGAISWKESAESAVAPKRKSENSKIESNEEISAETAAASQTENIKNDAPTLLRVVTNDGTPITNKNTSTERRGTDGDCEPPCSTITEEFVSVVDRSKTPFSRLTTSTVEELPTEKQSAATSTETSSGKDFPPTIESFAGIVTGLTGCMERVHIKRDGNSFVWPNDLPTFVPSTPLTVAANVLRWGTGAINVDGCRVPTNPGAPDGSVRTAMVDRTSPERYMESRPGEQLGRWPANVVHDGSDEVVAAAFPETGPSPQTYTRKADGCFGQSSYRIGEPAGKESLNFGDSGSAARFFYTSKADADDRLGSKHPTVKPLDLMQWLVRLVTPKNGTVLDCFAGTGTTGEAAWREGMSAVLIEAEPEYQADIRRRMALVLSGPDERQRESIKAKNLPRDDGPLFGGMQEAAE